MVKLYTNRKGRFTSLVHLRSKRVVMCLYNKFDISALGLSHTGLVTDQ